MRIGKISAITALALGAVTSANASTLSMDVTADNQFSVYLSSDPTLLGTLIGGGNNWQQNYALGPTALSGAVEYINVVVTNFTPANGFPQFPLSPTSNPSAFIGDFKIDTGYHFLNGLTTISTDAVNWLGSTPPTVGSSPSVTVGAWVQPTNPVTSYGTNDINPIWFAANGNAPVSDISGSAQWIFFGDQSTAQFADLQTEVFANSVTLAPTPLPSTWSMLLIGFAGLGFVAFRGNKKGSAASLAAV
jgi:hypothetical protein